MLVQREEAGQNFLEQVLQKCMELLFSFVGNPLLGSGSDEKALFERLMLQNLMTMQLLIGADNAAKSMNPLRSGRTSIPQSQRERGRYEELREQIMHRMSNAPIVVPAPVYDKIAFAAGALSKEIHSFGKGDARLEMKILNEYLAELERQQWKAHDLMSPLLLIIENKYAEHGALGYDASKPAGMGARARGQAGELEYWEELLPDANASVEHGGSRPMGGASKVQYSPQELQKYAQQLAAVDENVAQLLRAKNADMSELRLISVREMLRHYFEKNPKEFREIAISLLGMVPSEGDEALMQKLAYEIARIGSFALAYKMLLALREKKKMGELVCVRNLGVQKGKGKKVLICKRACGTAGMARGILELLIKKGSSSI
ncbi:Uncharacterised protein [Candidatus Anstonella stagnisolia]|nr:Uncharacterised protein [Candidatus Anstonella stagnisolia]